MTNANPEGLRSARIKIERAKDHIANLGERLIGWGTNNPYRMSPEYHPITGHRLIIWRKDRDIPDYVSAIIGDIVHNLRSALDHVVWALVIRNGRVPNDGTEFPINYDLATFEKNALRRLEGVGDEAVARIKALKPYKRGNGGSGNEILYGIHDLDRIDKHRSIVVVGAAHTDTELRLASATTIQDESQWITPPISSSNPACTTPIEDGHVIAEIAEQGLFPPGIYLHCSVTFHVLFGKGCSPAGQRVVEFMDLAREHVEGIINAFDVEFFR